MSDTVLCPACGKVIAVKGIPKHTNGCAKWAEVIGVPPSEFNFDRHYKRGVWAADAVADIDYVFCMLCNDIRVKRLADHLKHAHGMTTDAYLARFPKARVVAFGSIVDRQKTVWEKYGVSNVARAEEVKAKMRANDRSQSPEARLKRRLTNLERFGHENPLGGEQGKARAQGGMRAKHGVSNPQQAPAIRERTLATTEARYGDRFFFRTGAFKIKFVGASRERFGTDHPMMSPGGRALWVQGNRAAFGADNPMQLPEVRQRCYESNLANHGGKHSQQCPETLEKARATWIEKYGVDNPSKVEEIKAKIKDVWMGKYGVPFPPQSLWMNRTQMFPNWTEQLVQVLAPVNVVYTGDGSYWIRSPGVSRARSPDFVVLTADQLQAYRDGADVNDLRVYRVIEVFGDFWHGPKVTGKSRALHAQDVEGFYAKAGVQCLILWESELKKHPARVSERLLRFLGSQLGSE